MANKNLVKRAFSVTANLPAAASLTEPTAHQTPESPPVESLATADAVSGDSLPVSPPPAVSAVDGEGIASSRTERRAVSPRTGPGSMLAYMNEQSEVHKEVIELRKMVGQFDGAVPTRLLDPQTIVASAWANRDESHFHSRDFAELKDEIAAAGGNVQPIKVRVLPEASATAARYELVYGHRRHRACLELGLPVLALVQTQMPDSDLFVEMERENRNREDLSAWEQGMMYAKALELGLFPSARQLASAINRDLGNMGKAMALAKLPAEVVQAFGSPLNLQFRWSTPLKDIHQRDPERLLQIAREILSMDKRPTPAETFAMLTKGDTPAVHTDAVTEWKDSQGRVSARLVANRKGHVTVTFNQALDDAQRKKLSNLLDAFFSAQ